MEQAEHIENGNRCEHTKFKLRDSTDKATIVMAAMLATMIALAIRTATSDCPLPVGLVALLCASGLC